MTHELLHKTNSFVIFLRPSPYR